LSYAELVQFFTDCKIMVDDKKVGTAPVSTTQTPEPSHGSTDKRMVEPLTSKAHWISAEDIRQLCMQATFDAVLTNDDLDKDKFELQFSEFCELIFALAAFRMCV
jgi:hypothetical protein